MDKRMKTKTLINRYCITQGCENDSKAYQYSSVRGGKRCHKCNSRRYREKNPIKDSYRRLKSDANRRGIVVTISFLEFKGLLGDNPQYLESKLSDEPTLVIDRINPLKGYEVGNLQIVTASFNSRKANLYDKRVWNGEIDPKVTPYIDNSEENDYLPVTDDVDLEAHF
jgi:hypothetical protein